MQGRWRSLEKMKITYSNIINQIEKEIASIVLKLKEKKSDELITKKNEYDNALKWLKKGEKYQINPKSKFIILPEQSTKTPSSEFRIIEDHESDDKNNWQEIKVQDSEIRPRPDDVLIMKNCK